MFDGLASLKKLFLGNNCITKIGLNVFTASAGLVTLQEIEMANNNLADLEPWPLIRGLLVPHSRVGLEKNSIKTFTNKLGWGYRCGMPVIHMNLALSENKFTHITDFTNGWNITGQLTAIEVPI